MTKTEKRIQELETRLSFHVKAFNEYCQFVGSEIERLEMGRTSSTDRFSSSSPVEPPPNLGAARLTLERFKIDMPGSKVTAHART